MHTHTYKYIHTHTHTLLKKIKNFVLDNVEGIARTVTSFFSFFIFIIFFLIIFFILLWQPNKVTCARYYVLA